MKPRLKRALLITGAITFILVATFVIIVGPWPTYHSQPVADTKSYQSAVSAIDAALVPNHNNEYSLTAGWSKVAFEVPDGTPLAGFGNREGAPAEGARDPVAAYAISLHDGVDELVIIGADLLIIPENIADRVRTELCDQDGLCNPSTILFNATHTHSGPGGWGPGLAASLFAGEYNPKVEDALVEAFVQVVRAASASRTPAAIASGGVDVPDYVRNRAREGAVDPELSYLVVRRADGEACFVVSYAAHATVLGSGNMEFSADYPGYFMRAIERETGGLGMFLAGAVGSTSASVEGADGIARAETLGEALAARVVQDAKTIEFREDIDIASIGVKFESPSYQFRINQSWRLSPYLFPRLGVDNDVWIHGATIGDVFLYATPCDISGEIAIDWKAWAEAKGIDLWVLSFNGDYAGYVSPDRYYDTAQRGTDEEYEMFTMSWMGPDQEALLTELLYYLVPRVAGTSPDE
jgi:hypothetical protein